jgi:DNA-binding transcriptional LysR family regulator
MHYESDFDTWSAMLELRTLRYAVVVARRRSYARAAEELGISQPALTRSIQSLEKKLQIRLFDRDRAGVTTTPQGQAFIDDASVLVANAEELERRTAAASIGKAGQLRFGIAPMPARALLKATLGEFLREAPDITLDVTVRNVDALFPMLAAGHLEFFVSAEGQVPDTPPVRAEVLGQVPISYLVRPLHPLLSEKCEHRTFPILVSSKAGGLIPDELNSLTHGRPHVIEDSETLVALTAGSDGIWISSAFNASKEIRDGILSVLPSETYPVRRAPRLMMYTLERRTLSPAARAIKRVMVREIKEFEKYSKVAGSPPT